MVVKLQAVTVVDSVVTGETGPSTYYEMDAVPRTSERIESPPYVGTVFNLSWSENDQGALRVLEPQVFIVLDE